MVPDLHSLASPFTRSDLVSNAKSKPGAVSSSFAAADACSNAKPKPGADSYPIFTALFLPNTFAECVTDASSECESNSHPFAGSDP